MQTLKGGEMREYGFTSIIEGDIEAKLDEFFDAGCDDATFGSCDDVWHAAFDREAATLEAAIASAVTAVQSVAGVRVTSVQLDGNELHTLHA
jgi:hypothetical protein